MPDKIVVYAEDERALRTVGKSVLTQLGYDVHDHVDGKPALEEIRTLTAEGKQVALLTDNDMPQMTGKELIAQLAQDGIRVPTVMLSAHDKIAEELEAEGLADKVDVLLAKPLDVRTLREVIPMACAKQEALQPTSHTGFASKDGNGRIGR